MNFRTSTRVVVMAATLAAITGSAQAADLENSPLQHKVAGIDGNDLDLSKYAGKVVLIVNVASECGYTPQYEGLQALYKKYGKDGLVVLGVPANDFGRQEPGTEAQIRKFCKTNYDITFPMTAKMVLTGPKTNGLYKTLTAEDPNPKTKGKPVGWNFEKFLVDRKGNVVRRFTSGVEPTSDELVTAVKKEIDAKN